MNGTDKCRICGSARLKEINIGGTALIKCADCDIHYLKKIPSPEELSEYYKQGYMLQGEDYGSSEQRRVFRLPEQLWLVNQIGKYKQTGSILDIGCDKGFFLDEARRWGWQAHGVEPSEGGRCYCKAIGLNVYQDISQAGADYDIITMWHSLEHITTPVDFLNGLKKQLRPDGLIFIRVPDFGSFWSKRMGRRWVWFQPENHYFHYSLQSLRATLEQAGYELRHIESRKPNDSATKKMNSSANKSFRNIFGARMPLKKHLSRKYQDLTGVELFAVASLR